MSGEKKVVRGGFRATLALLIAICALVVAVIALNRTAEESDLRGRIRELQAKVDTLKTESADRIERMRGETAEALQRIAKSLKKSDKEVPETNP